MFKIICSSLLLIGACATAIQGWSQQMSSLKKMPTLDLAVTYTVERAKIASVDCGCFWLYGGSFSGVATFYHGLGVAANLTGDHASSIQPGVDLAKISLLAGPRYTYSPERWNKYHFNGSRPVALFGEALFGTVHGFDTIFPGSTGTRSSASSFSYQVGGGVDWLIKKNIGVRLLEADYVRSTLPNNGSDSQNDLRLAAGIVFHVK